MCKRIPFHHKANANSNDLKNWASDYLGMTEGYQAIETDKIRREINLANMRREACGMTTRITRPNIVPDIDPMG
jgi:hypothetical protein